MNKNLSHLVIGSFLVTVFGWLCWQEVKAQGADWLPVKYVRIEGAFQYLAKNKIKQVLQDHVKNGLYNTDIQLIKKSVSQLPWVKSVRVKRVWPDAIDITIDEQMPVFRWGKSSLLNAKGDVFVPDNISEFNLLPLISGPTGNEKKLLEVMKGIEVALSDHEMDLAEFHVNNRRAWTMKLKNGLNLKLGSHKPLNKFQRFIHTLDLFSNDLIAKIVVVDLRYPNGFALTWKEGEEEIDWNKLAEMRKI